MRIQDLKTSKKMGYGFGVLGLLFLILVAADYEGVRTLQASYEEVINIQSANKIHFLNADRYMLQARRSEKDFLMRLDTSYTKSVKTQTDAVIGEAKAVIRSEIARGHAADADALERIVESINQYYIAFQAVVEAKKEEGLDHESGLQGRFRKAVHDVEGIIVKDHQNVDLEASLLMLRQHEKDYMLRRLPKYLEEVDAEARHLEQKVTADSKLSAENKRLISGYLATYLKLFHELVVQDGKIVAISSTMREWVHKIEPLIEE